MSRSHAALLVDRTGLSLLLLLACPALPLELPLLATSLFMCFLTSDCMRHANLFPTVFLACRLFILAASS
ncbi:hypothetical protein C8Q74DRAFT_1250790 [Fomes fomentarius]|nr:hypothetical protein C8Q74DRAFT_1250790 [Fomes fomentarius]